MYPSHQHFHNSEVSWRWLIVMRREHASTSYRSSIQTAIYKVLAVRSSTLNLPKTRTHRGSDVAIHHFPFRATSQKVLLRPLQFFRAQDEIVPWRTCGTLEWPKGVQPSERWDHAQSSLSCWCVFSYINWIQLAYFLKRCQDLEFPAAVCQTTCQCTPSNFPLTSAHHT